ncbi:MULTISPECIES: SAP domain-containing protein [unclassified Rathayibacter]|uniref:SAP domain-containing protein n=1 Tax=unclassified Rathayibacter TaxID=2609250 RepID=UPI0014150EF3|nr:MULTISPECIES: SAP domain-containing protein [unclassified Rathayibacter]
MSIAGFRSVEALGPLPIGSPTVLAGHNDAGKTAIIDAISFLLGSRKLDDSDRTYLRGGVLDDDEAVRRVAETWVEGTFELRDTESGLGSSPLRVRRVHRNGTTSLEVLKQVPADVRLRDYAALKVDVLKDRLSGLGLPTDGYKADLVSRLDEAATAADTEEMWSPAETTLDRALPAGQRFDAASAVNAETAIQSTLQTAYRGHLESDELQGDVRTIEAELERKLTQDAEEIRDHIMQKVQDIGDVTIRPTVSFTSANGLKSTQITVLNPAGEEIGLQVSGAGRARRIALAVWEHNSTVLARSGEDVVLLYDEPDTHLDYGHQRELMRLIHEQTTHPNVTVVIASHSMNLIDGTDISDVVHVKHAEHRTILEHLADDSQVGLHLGAIAASVGLRNTVLLHERLFVGVEGETEARVIPVLFKLATGRHLESCGIALWPCHNNEGALRFAQFLAGHERKVSFLVDTDSKTVAKHVFSDERLMKSGLHPSKHCLYVGDPNEIEDVFSDAQWVTAANDLWIRDGDDVPSDTWSEADFASHRGVGKKFSTDVLRMVQRGSSGAPKGKPDMLLSLVLRLKTKDEVPAALIEVFEELMRRAQ